MPPEDFKETLWLIHGDNFEVLDTKENHTLVRTDYNGYKEYLIYKTDDGLLNQIAISAKPEYIWSKWGSL